MQSFCIYCSLCLEFFSPVFAWLVFLIICFFNLNIIFLEKPSLTYYILCYPLPQQLSSYSSNTESYFIFLHRIFILLLSLLFSCYIMSDFFSTLWAYRPPNSSVHWTSQARILEWVAISFSKASSPPRDQTHTCISRWILYHWATRETPS